MIVAICIAQAATRNGQDGRTTGCKDENPQSVKAKPAPMRPATDKANPASCDRFVSRNHRDARRFIFAKAASATGQVSRVNNDEMTATTTVNWSIRAIPNCILMTAELSSQEWILQSILLPLRWRNNGISEMPRMDRIERRT